MRAGWGWRVEGGVVEGIKVRAGWGWRVALWRGGAGMKVARVACLTYY